MSNRLLKKLDYEATFDCVQCGYCLPACPTYVAFEKEKHSPRGRINLVKMVAEGKVSLDDMRESIDLCLGCRACETVCPTNVQYGDILMSAVEVLNEDGQLGKKRKTIQNLAFKYILPNKGSVKTLNHAIYYYEKTGLKAFINRFHLLGNKTKVGELNQALPNVKKVTKQQEESRNSEHMASQGKYDQPVMRVGFFEGCIMDAFFSKINDLAVEIMKKHGVQVENISGQTCCGALQHHAGETDQTVELAKKNIAAYDDAGVDYVVNTIGGCGASLKEYDKLFKEGSYWHQRAKRFVSKVRDISEIMDQLELDMSNPVSYKAVYQPSCHLENVQQVFHSPQAVLEQVPSLNVVDMEGQSQCCGSAGIYNILHYDESMKILDNKMRNVEEAHPNLVITSNPGCHIQMQLGVEREGLSDQITVKHIVEVVAEACGINY